MSEHKAPPGEISGSLSTGPRYSVDEIEKGESILIENRDFVATVVDVREEEGGVIVTYDYPDRAGVNETSVNNVRKLDA
jgi:hypothetical protein